MFPRCRRLYLGGFLWQNNIRTEPTAANILLREKDAVKEVISVKKTALIIMITVIVAAVIILIGMQIGKKPNELVGTWVYDEHTQYIFEKDGTGKLLADDVAYDYIYSVKGDRLIIDFTKDIVRDCEYTFTTDNGILTLVGGSGTDGGSYKLNRK